MEKTDKSPDSKNTKDILSISQCYKEEKKADWEDENKMNTTNVYIAMLAVFPMSHRLAK
jgi:hypothetical protein